MNTSSFHVRAVLLIWCTYQAAHGQDFTPQCRQFQDLMEQKGLNWRTELRNQPLLPGQLLAPVIAVTNQAGVALQIPNLKSYTGMLIESPTRTWNEAEHKYAYRSVYHQPRKEGDKPFCLPDTILILPGETKEFNLAWFPDRLLEGEIDATRYIATASRNAGEQLYIFHLGRFRVEGYYQVAEAELVDYTCVDREVVRTYMEKGKMVQDPRKFCQPFAIVNLEGRHLLLAAVGAGHTIGYQAAVRDYHREKSALASRFLIERNSLVLTEVPPDTRFRISRSSESISLKQLIVQSSTFTHDSKWIEETYQESRKRFRP